MILIAGDSWGCGEWRKEPPGHGVCLNLEHSGLGLYLKEHGHDVINLSVPGFSNSSAIKSIKMFVQTNPWVITPGSAIFYFQTEWTRDLKELKNNTTVYFDINDLDAGYPNTADRFLSKMYCALSDLAVKHSVPIYIVGGCVDTIWIDQFSKEYPGVKIACQSLANFAVTDNHRIADPCYDEFSLLGEDAINQLKNKFSKNNQWLESLLIDLDKGRSRFEFWKANEQYFWPDGTHANRLAHKKLFDLLMSTIPELA